MDTLKRNDFLEYRFLSGLEPSPSLRHAVFTVSQADYEENGYRHNLWLYDAQTKQIRQLTAMDKENNAFWLDGSTLVFPSMRDKKCKERVEKGEAWTIFYAIDIHGGEAKEYMRLPLTVTKAFPAGENKFVFVVNYDNAGIDLHQYQGLEKQTKETEIKQNKDYEILDEIPYWSNGHGFTNKKRSRLYLYEKEENRLTPITEPPENAHCFCVEQGKALFSASLFQDKAGQTDGLYSFDVNTKERATLLEDNTWELGFAGFIGGRVFCTATDMLHYGINENKKFYFVENGALTLWADYDRSFGSGVGSDCRLGGSPYYRVIGEKLYFLTLDGFYSYVRTLDLKGNFETLTAPKGSVDGFAVNGDAILFIGMRGLRLQELYLMEQPKGAEEQITQFNEDIFQNKTLAQPEYLAFENDGVSLDGWVLKPIGFDPARKYPAILDIHGGPKSAFGDVFFHEMQIWANDGYFVFFCNLRGGDGKGNAFADIRGKYGTIDYDDLMKFTDLVLEKYPQIDNQRMGVTGGSYGGFMTNWIIGHTDRFCCAASQRSIANWISMSCTTDIGYYFSADQNNCDTWSDQEKLWWHSPLRYANQVKTPTLFIHSEEDYRCWLTEGLQMFNALKFHGVPSRLCMFRGENHELSRSGKPRHREKRLVEITAWFDQYLKK